MRAAALVLVIGCGAGEARVSIPAQHAARLPGAPGAFGPSLVAIDGNGAPRSGDPSDGAALSDVDGCGTCHRDAAAQWAASAHSFASFGNPIYRVNVELARAELGKPASQHCAGCHDMPLLVDGLMTSAADVPAADLRAHSGVTCRLCHGIEKTTKDGNGSYVWSRAPIDTPALDDPASIARHRAQVGVKSPASPAPEAIDRAGATQSRALGTELCVGCHRGFLGPDLATTIPHLSGLDEPGTWRSSPYTGNGVARVDKVDKQNCLDCHMAREAASAGELGAKHGTIASHRFVGGHSWMAAMRGDAEQLRRVQDSLAGAASIDVAGAFTIDPRGDRAWTLPADGAPIVPGTRVALDVVVRNLRVGHRFPGGVLDIQDTWIEVEVRDRRGARIAASGLAHERDPKDEEAHVLRTLVVNERGEILEHHEMAKFRTQIATQTLAPRDAQAIRYELAVPRDLSPAQLPLTVTARLRHRSRTLQMQETTCAAAKTPEGRAFLAGAKGARYVDLDPCRAQPITLVAEVSVQLGAGARAANARPAWERSYEHGMALVATVSERLDEARAVLEAALAKAPDDRARSMVIVQLAQVASKQGRVDDALALVAKARALLPEPGPAVLDMVAADALMRVWRWDEAVAPAREAARKAPQNTLAWVMLARCLGSTGDDVGALDAATAGLELAPRDPDLLRSQATALAALHRPEAAAALAAYDRYRSPDNSAELRIECAGDSPRCARDREQASTYPLR
jgi:tetratricopeptide (TPR) repeat protein